MQRLHNLRLPRKIQLWRFNMLKAVLSAIFGSLFDRFFPPETADAQKADDLAVTVKESQAMAEAAAEAPTAKSEIIDTLKNGSICLVFLLLQGCATSSACPSIHNWSAVQQDQIAAQIDVLPENSPLIPALDEWASLRAQAKACQKVR